MMRVGIRGLRRPPESGRLAPAWAQACPLLSLLRSQQLPFLAFLFSSPLSPFFPVSSCCTAPSPIFSHSGTSPEISTQILLIYGFKRLIRSQLTLNRIRFVSIHLLDYSSVASAISSHLTCLCFFLETRSSRW